ncbi:hypothetical protein [Hymenobacter algoricola]|uniref:Uncharacterized protein n=1 Tax=Hymenobacter algoricola TaxID=486267 RepID=A0ABP7N6U6_9BACT
MKKTFEDESDALSAHPTQPTTAQPAATTTPAATGETPVPVAGNGAPDYSKVAIKTEPELPREVEPGGSATEPESGGGYSG